MKRNALLVTIFVLTLFMGCDYFKSKEVSPEKKLEFAEKCSKAGNEYYDKFISEFGKLYKDYLWADPEFHYNSRLNTCLVDIKFSKLWGPSLRYSTHSYQVIDVFANKPLLYGWFQRDAVKNTETLNDSVIDGVPNYTSVEYFKQRDKLFSE
jgi:hypothetical protein